MDNNIWINMKTTNSQTLAADKNLKKKELSLEEMVPMKYHEHLDIFDKKTAD